MISAKHNKFFRKIFNIYIDCQLKKHFNNFFLLSEIPVINNDKSILILPNHFSWWDGFFVDLLCRKFFSSHKIYMMVLEETVRRFWFFNHIGAFSINPNNPKDIIKSFSYVEKLLREKKNIVVIFPQGELKPFSTDVDLKQGTINFIVNREKDFHLFFLAMKIVYLNEKKPNVYFHLLKSPDVSAYINNHLKFINDFRFNLSLLENKIMSENCQKILL